MRRNAILLVAVGSVFIAGQGSADDILKAEQLVSPMADAAGFNAEESVFGDAGVVDLQDLGALRGREGGMSVTVATDQELNAAVVGGAITADNFTTGGVSFGENAFDNFGGVGLVNVVTGNNNAIEAAIGVTFNLLD